MRKTEALSWAIFSSFLFVFVLKRACITVLNTIMGKASVAIFKASPLPLARFVTHSNTMVNGWKEIIPPWLTLQKLIRTTARRNLSYCSYWFLKKYLTGCGDRKVKHWHRRSEFLWALALCKSKVEQKSCFAEGITIETGVSFVNPLHWAYLWSSVTSNTSWSTTPSRTLKQMKGTTVIRAWK